MKTRILLALALCLLATSTLRAETGPGGSVTLPLEEYLRLIAPTPTPASSAAFPPRTHLFSNGRYSLEAGREWVVVDGRVDLNLQAGGWQEIPLLPSGVVLSEVTLDGRAAPVYEKEDTIRFLARGRGNHQVRVVYHAPLSVEGASRHFEFRSVAGAPGTARLVLPGSSLKIQTLPSLPLDTSAEGGRTVVRMPLPGPQGTRVTWSPRSADPGLAGQANQQKARLSALIFHLIQVSEGEIRNRVLLECAIQRNQVDSLVLEVPPDAQVTELTCPGLAGWEVLDRPSDRRIHVALSKPVTGSLTLNLTLETPLANPDSTWEIPWVGLAGAEKSKSWLGLAASEALELTPVDSSQTIRRTDPSLLPPQVQALGTLPPLLAYEGSGFPWSVRVESRLGKHLPLLTAAVDEASGQTLVTAQGKTISTFTWKLRNNQNQYLKVQLPVGARIWSAFVDGQAVKPVQEGPILKLPLVSSQQTGQELQSFPVEITFVGAETGQAWLGSVLLEAPRLPGVPTSQFAWTVLLPEDWKALDFSGSVEPSDEEPFLPDPPALVYEVDSGPFGSNEKSEKRKSSQDQPPSAPPAALPGVALGAAETDGGAFSEEALESEPEEAPQSAMAQMVQTTSQGSFPVRVRVPVAGQGYRFTQLMVAEDAPTLRVLYYQPQLLEAVWWGALLAILALGLRFTDQPSGWKKLVLAATVLAFLGWLLAGTPGDVLVSGALVGLALLGLAWLIRQRRWLLDTFRYRRQRSMDPGPACPKEEVPS
ncbi:MAG: hypothetical protein ACOX9B_09475 [Candidatus Xenobium sp.]|jgi:hypothetical protein